MNKKIISPHDKVFKKAMADVRVARNFFEHYLPQNIKELIDLDILSLSPNSYVDDDLNNSSSDVLYETQIANMPAFLYILIEHYSSAKPFIPLKNLHYKVRIWFDYIAQNPETKTLPLIVPLVFYNGETPYIGPKDIRELIHAPNDIIDKILFKPFHLIDTHHIDDETLREQYWAGILIFLMKHIHARDFIRYINPFAELIREMIKNEGDGASNYIEILLKYFLKAGKSDQPRHIIDTVVKYVSKPLGDKIMSKTIIEWWQEEAREEAKQEGKLEGKLEGESNMLKTLIQHKFGVISPPYLEKIEKADCETLLKWGERILIAKNVEQIFGGVSECEINN